MKISKVCFRKHGDGAWVFITGAGHWCWQNILFLRSSGHFHWLSIGVWEVLLPTASHLPAGRQETCALLLTFFPLGVRVRSEIISPYVPLCLISFHIYTSYWGVGSSAKRKSMIVRFVQCHKKSPEGATWSFDGHLSLKRTTTAHTAAQRRFADLEIGCRYDIVMRLCQAVDRSSHSTHLFCGSGLLLIYSNMCHVSKFCRL